MRFLTGLIALFIAPRLAQHQVHAGGGPTQTELNAAGESVEWLLPNHDYAGQRFVDLKQIKRDNAAQLGPICIYQAGDVGALMTLGWRSERPLAGFSRIRSSTRG